MKHNQKGSAAIGVVVAMSAIMGTSLLYQGMAGRARNAELAGEIRATEGLYSTEVAAANVFRNVASNAPFPQQESIYPQPETSRYPGQLKVKSDPNLLCVSANFKAGVADHRTCVIRNPLHKPPPTDPTPVNTASTDVAAPTPPSDEVQTTETEPAPPAETATNNWCWFESTRAYADDGEATIFWKSKEPCTFVLEYWRDDRRSNDETRTTKPFAACSVVRETISGLSRGLYYWRVKAKNARGTVTASETKSFRIY